MLPTIDCRGDEFILRLPNSNRIVTVPASATGIAYLKKIIQEGKRGFLCQPSGYVRDYPTQHVIEKWLKRDRQMKTDAQRKALEEKTGISLDELEIKL